MSYEKEKPYSSSSSGVDIPTPSSTNPPSPQMPAHEFKTAPPSQSHQQTLLLFSAIYPFTIILGSLFSLVAPNGKSASYFSHKNNLFNVLFVKVGWFWTTAAFIVHVWTIRHPNRQAVQTKALVRYGLATLTWILVTQWFFGPPLMDRTFTLTGGMCQPDSAGYYTEAGANSGKFSAKAEEAFTSAACKMAGGSWTGGHDLSGHTFMLTHASLFLWAEMMPRLLDMRRRNVNTAEYAGVHWFVWAIMGLWWWMLLMTSVYFHTWKEKMTGWIVALIEWSFLYLYAIPSSEEARQVVGTPVV